MLLGLGSSHAPATIYDHAGAALATAGPFRPGGLSWAVAERALCFLKALGSLGTAGLQWVAASMPALQSAMLASLDHSRPLRSVLLMCAHPVLCCSIRRCALLL